MQSRVYRNVEKNCEYHEALATSYERLLHETADNNPEHGKLAYLAKLHGDCAQQLRQVLGQPVAPAIDQAVASRTIRRENTGRLN